jgi:hypothetical protein
MQIIMVFTQTLSRYAQEVAAAMARAKAKANQKKGGDDVPAMDATAAELAAEVEKTDNVAAAVTAAAEAKARRDQAKVASLVASTLASTSDVSAKVRRAKFEELAKPGEDGLARRKALFKAIDANSDGIITIGEALWAIRSLWDDFDNVSACLMAYEAADRDGGMLGWRETRLFFKYQLFYDDAWEIFQLVDTDKSNTIDRDEFSRLDAARIGIADPSDRVRCSLSLSLSFWLV